jgi:3-isopropylmalate dehydrogenase
MKTYDIAVIGGDGTGPEVTAEALKVAEAAARKFGFRLNWHAYDVGGERYLKTGEVLPDSVVDELRKFKAIYLGAVGHPQVKPGILEKGILLRLRFELGQYINLRPVKLYRAQDCPVKDKGPEHVDFIVVRENNEGLYAGAGGNLFKGTPHEVAVQESINTRRGVDRCLHYAFEVARKRRHGQPWKGLKPEDLQAGKTAQLILCGKTNVLTYAFDLWWRGFQEMAPAYPTVKTDYAHVDAICMWFVKNPEWFDVIVTDNMFGDIITDLAAMIQGGLGVAAGGNINPDGTSMFEPMGGSAPKYTGRNVINPIAAINAGAMMLDFLGEGAAAAAIEAAVIQIITTRIQSLAAGKMGHGTREVGDLIAGAL